MNCSRKYILYKIQRYLTTVNGGYISRLLNLVFLSLSCLLPGRRSKSKQNVLNLFLPWRLAAVSGTVGDVPFDS